MSSLQPSVLTNVADSKWHFIHQLLPFTWHSENFQCHKAGHERHYPLPFTSPLSACFRVRGCPAGLVIVYAFMHSRRTEARDPFQIKQLHLEPQGKGARPWLIGGRRGSSVSGSDSPRSTTPSAASCSESEPDPDCRRAGWERNGGNNNRKRPRWTRGQRRSVLGPSWRNGGVRGTW